jgi:anti-sigma B factor antagonist
METIKLKNEVPAIILEGEVDVYTSPQLKQQLIDIYESGAKQVIVDLSKVEYIDSSALGVIIGGLKRMREVGGNMSLICPNPRVRRVFEITGLDKIFDIYNSSEDALQETGKESS